MSQDLRLYTLSLLIVLMLWNAPAHGSYGAPNCPSLAVPINLAAGDIWHSGDDVLDDGVDFRDLFPMSGTTVTAYTPNSTYDCTIFVGKGTYYDGANHLWVLDDDLSSCVFSEGDGVGVDFRAGDVY